MLRVALVLRSTEVHPEFFWFVSSSPFPFSSFLIPLFLVLYQNQAFSSRKSSFLYHDFVFYCWLDFWLSISCFSAHLSVFHLTFDFWDYNFWVRTVIIDERLSIHRTNMNSQNCIVTDKFLIYFRLQHFYKNCFLRITTKSPNFDNFSRIILSFI